MTRLDDPDAPDCVCGHPADDHDANECWTDVTRGVQSDSPSAADQCPCSHYRPGVA